MWLRGFADFARGVNRLIFPNACLVCDAPEGDRTDFRHGLCSNCFRSITNDPHGSCPRCAATVGPHTDVTEGCTVCRVAGFGFVAAVRMGPHEGRLRDAILRMKLSAGEGLAEQMGKVFWEVACSRLSALDVGVVVPVPLHWRKKWQRGFNQSELLAAAVAKRRGVPLLKALRRKRPTAVQASLAIAGRRRNVAGAFVTLPDAELKGKRILLIDDVMTTGATAGACAAALKRGGATSVSLLTLARVDRRGA